MIKKYATATAFRTALETRLKNHSRNTGTDLHRLRRKVAFDRLLQRLFQSFPQELLLKGGYAMELRLKETRTTKDIDLVMKTSGNSQEEFEIRQRLQDAVQKDLGDFFEFLVGNSTLDLEAVPYGGFRYPIEVRLDGRLFIRFPIDVVTSSLFLNPLDQVQSENWLAFAGIETSPFPAISKEQQFAEKLHAYTLPQDERQNSRVKDLADMYLLIQIENLDQNYLDQAIQKTFEYRNTHLVPDGLFMPPENWAPKYDKLRRECNIDLNLDESIGKIAQYLQLPILVDSPAVQLGNKGNCHFCEIKAFKRQVPNYPIVDVDCEACGLYRMTDRFSKVFNGKNNIDNWESWIHYLQNRSNKMKAKRILIASFCFSPPKL